MPPKPKYTREQIVEAALQVIAEKGVNALTAKALGNALHTSTTPIFTVFNSMQEVQDAARDAAMERFSAYIHAAPYDTPRFKQIGMQTIRFAREEPRLYQLLFMSAADCATSFDEVYVHLGEVADESMETLQKDYGLTGEKARTLFEHVWLHTFGIAALCATGVCNFSPEKIACMLTQDFTAMLMLLKSEEQ